MSKNVEQIDEQASFLVKKIEIYQQALNVHPDNSLLHQIAQREDGKELLKKSLIHTKRCSLINLNSILLFKFMTNLRFRNLNLIIRTNKMAGYFSLPFQFN